jgi:hypothetical protein
MPKHHHEPPHDDDTKHAGPPRGPKERELAVALTVAVLQAAHVEGSLEEVERIALRTFNRMLDGITATPSPALPPTATIGSSN